MVTPTATLMACESVQGSANGLVNVSGRSLADQLNIHSLWLGPPSALVMAVSRSVSVLAFSKGCLSAQGSMCRSARVSAQVSAQQLAPLMAVSRDLVQNSGRPSVQCLGRVSASRWVGSSTQAASKDRMSASLTGTHSGHPSAQSVPCYHHAAAVCRSDAASASQSVHAMARWSVRVWVCPSARSSEGQSAAPSAPMMASVCCRPPTESVQVSDSRLAQPMGRATDRSSAAVPTVPVSVCESALGSDQASGRAFVLQAPMCHLASPSAGVLVCVSGGRSASDWAQTLVYSKA